MYRRDTYKFHRFCCRVNTIYPENRETSLIWGCIVARAYGTCTNTGNRLVIFPCTQSVYLVFVTALQDAIIDLKVLPLHTNKKTHLRLQLKTIEASESESTQT